MTTYCMTFNSLGSRQNCHHFTDDIFKCIFLNDNHGFRRYDFTEVCSAGSNNNIPALVQIMAWCRPGNKPLSEPMMVSLLTHICGTQWVKIRQIFFAISHLLLGYLRVFINCLIFLIDSYWSGPGGHVSQWIFLDLHTINQIKWTPLLAPYKQHFINIEHNCWYVVYW